MNQFDKLIESLKCSCYDKDKNIFNNLDKRDSEKLLEIIANLEKKKKIVFRGFSEKQISPSFWDFIFTVGEKGNCFRNDLMGFCTNGNVGYFSNHCKQDQENYYYLLNALCKNIIPKYKHKYLIKNIDTLEDSIEEYRIKNNKDFIEMYNFLLLWLHNIGKCTGYKHDSPLISTTLSLDVAFKFNDKDSRDKYAFVIIVTEDKKSDYFYTSKLNKILREFDVDWHKDENKEVMFKDAIFPQLIIGILKKENNKTCFIINPSLMKFLKSKIPNSLIEKFLIKSGILVNQQDFDRGLKALKYRGSVEQLDNERKILKGNKKFNVRSIKDI